MVRSLLNTMYGADGGESILKVGHVISNVSLLVQCALLITCCFFDAAQQPDSIAFKYQPTTGHIISAVHRYGTKRANRTETISYTKHHEHTETFTSDERLNIS